MKKYKVAYATGSRADYGIVRNYLKKLNNDESVILDILVTGSHLEEKYGHSVDVIKNDGFNIAFESKLNIESTLNCDIIGYMSKALKDFGVYFQKNKYDLIIVLGDRYEMMAVSIAAAMQNIPILHFHGGEVTYGNYDEFIRHSITKMSRYHFVSTEVYKKRVIQLGEDPKNVFCFGALGAENCMIIDDKNVSQEIKELKEKGYAVLAFHPETLTNINTCEQINIVLESLKCLLRDYKVIIIGSNADSNSNVIREQINKFVKENECTYFENLNTDSYLYLIKNSICLIGNSSSGIIEAPTLNTYTINIGDRQKGRVTGNSVFNVKCDKKDIEQAIYNVIKLNNNRTEIFNPYYQQNSSNRYYQKTIEILKRPVVDVKEFYDLD